EAPERKVGSDGETKGKSKRMIAATWVAVQGFCARGRAHSVRLRLCRAEYICGLLLTKAVLSMAQEDQGPEHRGQTVAGSRLMAAHFSPSPGGEGGRFGSPYVHDPEAESAPGFKSLA